MAEQQISTTAATRRFSSSSPTQSRRRSILRMPPRNGSISFYSSSKAVIAASSDDGNAFDGRQKMKGHMTSIRHHHHHDGEEHEGEEVDQLDGIPPDDKSLCCIERYSPVRVFCVHVVLHRYFQWFILSCIIVNSILLALDQPAIQNPKELDDTLLICEYFFAIVFSIEMVLKIIAFGFILHRQSYMRNPWNVLDFFIVWATIIALAGVGKNFSALRVFRVLRPLRSVSRIKRLKLLIAGLFRALPTVINNLLLLAFIMFLFAIAAVQLWAGRLNQRCYVNDFGDVQNVTELKKYYLTPTPFLIRNDERNCGGSHSCDEVFFQSTENSLLEDGYLPTAEHALWRNATQVACASHENIYFRKYLNYNNIGTGSLLLLKIIVLDDWGDDLEDAMNMSGKLASLFFITLIIVGSFLCVNLFLAILTKGYSTHMVPDETESAPNEVQVVVGTVGGPSSPPRRNSATSSTAAKRRKSLIVLSADGEGDQLGTAAAAGGGAFVPVEAHYLFYHPQIEMQRVWCPQRNRQPTMTIVDCAVQVDLENDPEFYNHLVSVLAQEMKGHLLLMEQKYSPSSSVTKRSGSMVGEKCGDHPLIVSTTAASPSRDFRRRFSSFQFRSLRQHDNGNGSIYPMGTLTKEDFEELKKMSKKMQTLHKFRLVAKQSGYETQSKGGRRRSSATEGGSPISYGKITRKQDEKMQWGAECFQQMFSVKRDTDGDDNDDDNDEQKNTKKEKTHLAVVQPASTPKAAAWVTKWQPMVSAQPYHFTDMDAFLGSTSEDDDDAHQHCYQGAEMEKGKFKSRKEEEEGEDEKGEEGKLRRVHFLKKPRVVAVMTPTSDSHDATTTTTFSTSINNSNREDKAPLNATKRRKTKDQLLGEEEQMDGKSPTTSKSKKNKKKNNDDNTTSGDEEEKEVEVERKGEKKKKRGGKQNSHNNLIEFAANLDFVHEQEVWQEALQADEEAWQQWERKRQKRRQEEEKGAGQTKTPEGKKKKKSKKNQQQKAPRYSEMAMERDGDNDDEEKEVCSSTLASESESPAAVEGRRQTAAKEGTPLGEEKQESPLLLFRAFATAEEEEEEGGVGRSAFVDIDVHDDGNDDETDDGSDDETDSAFEAEEEERRFNEAIENEGFLAALEDRIFVKNDKRAKWRRTLGNFIESGPINLFILIVTVINTITLAIDHWGIDPTLLKVLDWTSIICTIFFIIHLGIKVIAFGPYLTFSKGFNVFDLIMILLSIPDMLLTGGASGFTILRAFRMVRAIRLFRSFESVQVISQTIIESTASVAWLSLLILLFLYVFAIMGMQLFGMEYFRHNKTEGWQSRESFGTLWESLLMCFIVMTGDNWTNKMKTAMSISAQDSFLSPMFFCTVYMLGNFVLINLFVAIIMDKLAEKIEEMGEEITPPVLLLPDLAILKQDDDLVGEGSGFFSSSLLSQSTKSVRNGSSPLSGVRGENATGQDQKENENFNPHDQNAEEEVGKPGLSSEQSAIHYAFPVVEEVEVEGWGKGKEDENEGEKKENCSAPDGHVSTSSSSSSSLSSKPSLQNSEREREWYSLKKKSRVTIVTEGEGQEEVSRCQPNDEDLSHQAPESSKVVVHSAFIDELVEERSQCSHQWNNLLQTILYVRPYIVRGDSFWLFAPENKFRKFLLLIFGSALFDWLIMACVLGNIIFLCFEGSRNTRRTQEILDSANDFFTAIFMIEMFFKWIAFGCFWPRLQEDIDEENGTIEDRWKPEPNDPIPMRPYFRDGWNWVDAVVNVLSVFAIFFPIFKASRSLRTLRLMIRNEHTKLIIVAMLQSIPHVLQGLCFVAFVFFILGVLAVQLYKGEFYQCSDTSVLEQVQCHGNFTVRQTGPVFDAVKVQERVWQRMPFHFNHLGASVLALFIVSVGDNWSDIMYQGMDTSTPGRGLETNKEPWMALFFVIVYIACNFFAFNMIIGILVNYFSKMKKVNDGSALLTPEQRLYVKARFAISNTMFNDDLIPLDGTISEALGKFLKYRRPGASATSIPVFELVMTAIILVNTAFIAAYHKDMKEWEYTLIEVINIISLVIFTIEVILKMLAYGPRQYFSLNWNQFDFFVVVLGYAAFGFAGKHTSSWSFVRVLRIIKLVKESAVQHLLQSVGRSFNSFVNVLALVILTFFVFAVAGVILFGEVKFNGAMNENMNFVNVPYAMLLLFRCATTDAWQDLMHAASIAPPDCSEEVGNCGNIRIATAYFCSFMVLCAFTILQLFVAVVVEIFTDEVNYSDPVIQGFSELKEMWAKKLGVGVNIVYYVDFIDSIPFFPRVLTDLNHNPRNAEVFHFLASLQIPVDSKYRVSYRDVVNSIAWRKFGVDVRLNPSALGSTLYEWLSFRYSFTVAECYAAFLVQKRWREHQSAAHKENLELLGLSFNSAKNKKKKAGKKILFAVEEAENGDETQKVSQHLTQARLAVAADNLAGAVSLATAKEKRKAEARKGKVDPQRSNTQTSTSVIKKDKKEERKSVAFQFSPSVVIIAAQSMAIDEEAAQDEEAEAEEREVQKIESTIYFAPMAPEGEEENMEQKILEDKSCSILADMDDEKMEGATPQQNPSLANITNSPVGSSSATVTTSAASRSFEDSTWAPSTIADHNDGHPQQQKQQPKEPQVHANPLLHYCESEEEEEEENDENRGENRRKQKESENQDDEQLLYQSYRIANFARQQRTSNSSSSLTSASKVKKNNIDPSMMKIPSHHRIAGCSLYSFPSSFDAEEAKRAEEINNTYEEEMQLIESGKLAAHREKKAKKKRKHKEDQWS